MSSSFVSLFCKQTSCPSSELLLSYGAEEQPVEQHVWIASHLSVCDFCGAELQLLARHQTTEEEFPLVEMPANLRHLAEAILGRDLNRVEIYTEGAYDKAPLTLTDA